MTDAYIEIWLGVLTLVGVVYPAWIREKNKRIEEKQAELSRQSLQKATDATALITELQEEVRVMRENRREDAKEIRQIHVEFRALQKTLLELEYGVKILIAQLNNADIVPAWSPVSIEDQLPD